MPNKQQLPLFVFGACLVLALALAVLTGEWAASLAIALAGLALAFAMQPPEPVDHDTAFIEEDLTELQAADARRSAEIEEIRGSIDELASIIEAVASDAAAVGGQIEPQMIDDVRQSVARVSERLTEVETPQQNTQARLDNLEQSFQALRQSNAAQAMQAAQSQPVALADTQPVARAVGQGGRSLVDSAVSMSDYGNQPRETLKQVVNQPDFGKAPLFDADFDAPKGMMIIDPSEKPDAADTLQALAGGLELTGGDPVFVRVPQSVVGQSDFAAGVEVALQGSRARELVLMLPQSALSNGIPKAVAHVIEAGGGFALERMTNWSVDLADMAESGLRYISVDGPAMARSAASQQGDPTRLKAVLASCGIGLIAANIEYRAQLDAVMTLTPDLFTGSGLLASEQPEGA